MSDGLLEALSYDAFSITIDDAGIQDELNSLLTRFDRCELHS